MRPLRKRAFCKRTEMKDKSARALAIVALVFMGLFVAALVATLVDYKLLGGSIGFIALGCGVFALMIFVALKADGRGFSMTQINNEIEMQKLEKEAAEKNVAAAKQSAPEPAPTDGAENAETERADDGAQAADGEQKNNDGADGRHD